MSSLVNTITKGALDVSQALKTLGLAAYLSYSDIRQRYRRSTIGPFWISISTGVMIGTIGIIFGNIFKSPLSEFLPFLSSGLIIWSLISSVLTEASMVFVSSEAIIKQLPIPLFTHVLRMVLRNFIIFFHNLIIIPFVFFFVNKSINWDILLLIPGLLILLLNLLWMSLFIGIICTRFRDITQIIVSFLQVVFYVTPIIWLPSLLPAKADLMLLDPNPFYHLIEIVRAPLIGCTPTFLDYGYTILLFLLGTFASLWLFGTFRGKIPYWL